MNVEDPGPHRTQKLPPHIAEDVVLRVEARWIQEHHLHEAVGIVGDFLQPQRLAQSGHGRKRALEEAMLGGCSRLVGLVEEAFAEIDAAQNVLVVDRHLKQLDVGSRVLDVGLHQRRAQLNVLDQLFLLAYGPFNQCSLLGGELVRLLVLWFLLCVRASHTQENHQEGEGELPKHHVKLLG